MFQNKALGAALVNIGELVTRENYLASIKGRNSGAHFAKKARSRGYIITEIDRNQFVDEIHDINTSLETRQGHAMDPSYLEKNMLLPIPEQLQVLRRHESGREADGVLHIGILR
ncbi:hypothetical protein ACFS07_02305 [Undibacterium arcticum]